ncbi:hypothetical protein HDU87_001065 [Geranomyces variabilis]|uniref:Uncharacterized protein n=1 Tax=Geranomyces variabilis TaxID=109894 RepID=A0AAD5XS44_9FUNG|nr:hypothetical protein HDU87_001065 [Geranomyces variabilis]
MSAKIEPSAWVLYAASMLAATAACVLAALTANVLVFLWRWCGFAADTFFDDYKDEDEIPESHIIVSKSCPPLSPQRSAEPVSSTQDPQPNHSASSTFLTIDSRVTVLETQVVESLRRIANLEKTSIVVVNGDDDDDPAPLFVEDTRASAALKRRRGRAGKTIESD